MDLCKIDRLTLIHWILAISQNIFGILMAKFCDIIDLLLVIGAEMSLWENRCAVAIVEKISLSTSFILLIALHFR